MSTSHQIPVTDRTTLKRHPERGTYDRAALDAILEEGLVAHVGFVANGKPYVIPTLFARLGDTVYIHGSAISRMLGTIGSGVDVCITVTLLDGLVLARSVFNHSMNYRSAVIFGTGRAVTDRAEKLAALHATVEHVVKGRWDEARQPTENEMAATLVVGVPLTEASVKIRTGPPKDDKDDYRLPVWAGVIPLALTAGAPIPDPVLAEGTAVPRYAEEYKRHGS
jgi:nitroimidazol reductase NimA-like FMN-containing flavoprotein (pyridoxamine 5'-phosphate oxidase superfamily)